MPANRSSAFARAASAAAGAGRARGASAASPAPPSVSLSARRGRPGRRLQRPFRTARRAAGGAAAVAVPAQPGEAHLLRSLTGFTRQGAAPAARCARSSPARRAPTATPSSCRWRSRSGADGRIAVADMGRRCVHLYLPEAARRRRRPRPVPRSSPAAARSRSSRRSVWRSTTRRASTSPTRPAGCSPSAPRASSCGAGGRSRAGRRDASAAAHRPRLQPGPTQLLYVVDTLAHRIYGLRTDGTLELSFGGRGEGVESFNFPTHIFPGDRRGPGSELFVTDTLNFRISSFDEDGAAARRLRPARRRLGRPRDAQGGGGRPRRRASTSSTALFDNVQLFDRDGALPAHPRPPGHGAGRVLAAVGRLHQRARRALRLPTPTTGACRSSGSRSVMSPARS